MWGHSSLKRTTNIKKTQNQKKRWNIKTVLRIQIHLNACHVTYLCLMPLHTCSCPHYLITYRSWFYILFVYPIWWPYSSYKDSPASRPGCGKCFSLYWDRMLHPFSLEHFRQGFKQQSVLLSPQHWLPHLK